MDWIGFVVIAAGWITAFIFGHVVTKRENAYRKNLEKTEIMNGEELWEKTKKSRSPPNSTQSNVKAAENGLNSTGQKTK
jgi:hypothetical protein